MCIWETIPCTTKDQLIAEIHNIYCKYTPPEKKFRLQVLYGEFLGDNDMACVVHLSQFQVNQCIASIFFHIIWVTQKNFNHPEHSCSKYWFCYFFTHKKGYKYYALENSELPFNWN